MDRGLFRFVWIKSSPLNILLLYYYPFSSIIPQEPNAPPVKIHLCLSNLSHCLELVQCSCMMDNVWKFYSCLLRT
jgi:hypothetical protein